MLRAQLCEEQERMRKRETGWWLNKEEKEERKIRKQLLTDEDARPDDGLRHLRQHSRLWDLSEEEKMRKSAGLSKS